MVSAIGRPTKTNQSRDKFDDAPVAVANTVVDDGDGDGVLPRDVLWEVLLRLRADELYRLRLVCRSWRSLTSDPAFTRAHSSRRPVVIGLHRQPRIIPLTSPPPSGYNIFRIRQPPPPQLAEIRIVDVMSGAIMKRIAVPRLSFDLSVQHDYICVTVMKERSFVLDRVTGKVTSFTTCLDNFVESSFILGFVPSTGEYKVLQFPYDAGVQRCFAMTFNGGGDGDGAWRERPPHPVVPVEPNSARHTAAIIGGFAYFLLAIHYTELDEAYADIEPDSIASFDLAAEEWKPARLRGPVSRLLEATGVKKLSYSKDRRDFQLTELDGNLVISHYKTQDSFIMDVWFLVDIDKGAWSRRYSIWCAPVWEYSCYNMFRPVVVLDDGRIVMWRVIDQVLRMYDLRTSTWETMPWSLERGMLQFVRM